MVGWLFVDWRFNGYVKGAGCIPGVLETHHTAVSVFYFKRTIPPISYPVRIHRHNALMLFLLYNLHPSLLQ